MEKNFIYDYLTKKYFTSTNNDDKKKEVEEEEEEKKTTMRVEKVVLSHVKRDYLAFVVYNVYSEEECKNLIQQSEDKHYEQALLNVGYNHQILDTDVRKSARCIIDSHEMANDLLHRLEKHLPKEFNGGRITCVNERMRFLRYYKGDYFRPHMDGCFARKGEISKVTLQIYLNEGFKGGSTRFLSDDESTFVDVVPKTGSVLVFEHRLLHEGSELEDGVKYTIRTDVMYENTSMRRFDNDDGDNY